MPSPAAHALALPARFALLIAVLPSLPARAGAQPTPGDAPAPGVSAPGRIEGRVVVAGTDLPLAGAALTIRGPGDTGPGDPSPGGPGPGGAGPGDPGSRGAVQVRTREDGRFRAGDLAPGRYHITAEHPGFAPGHTTVALQPGGVSRPVLALAAAETIEITGRYRDPAQLRRESAEAVTVVETAEARRGSADLGEVLARSQGVAVRRAGGLGADARLSLDGLQEDQIRFFLDGVPLELAGYGLGIANVPVNLIERVEIHRGVVPIRLGADALGGAVELVTSRDTGRAASISYQAGSFGVHRATATGRLPLGEEMFVRAAGFLDVARNDYAVDVEIPDERGRLMPVRVERFHDGYRAAGGNLELGLPAGPGGGRLRARAFVTGYDKDLQHNLVMTVPYGEVRYGERAWGATLRWHAPRLSERASASLLAAYGGRRIRFVDRSAWVYDWFGDRIRERAQPGEIDGDAMDATLREDSVMARALAAVRAGGHTLRLAWSPAITRRSGRDRLHTGTRDPLSARRELLGMVTGLEHELDAFGDRLENLIFLKHYWMLSASEEVLPGGIFQPLERSFHRLGAGDAARLRLREDLWLKASYELATRMPRPEELFGDGITIQPNLALAPETSHNGNAGIGFDLRGARAGTLRGELRAFLRYADRLIVLLGDDRAFTYQNVWSGRTVGVDAAIDWTAPGGWLDIDAAVTAQDLRNTSTEGPFAGFAGDRIPNRPWLLASGGVRLRRADLLRPGVDLWAEWTTRYVHRFFRSWERIGRRDTKQVVPSQLVHTALAGARLGRAPLVTATVELHNLTGARAYDYFGVQKPGRALYVKLTAEY